MGLSATRIREARQDAGLTRTEVGALIGRSEQSIVSYELSRSTPPVEIVTRLASVLGVPVAELFEEETRHA